jgi:arylsulfatase A-like enzyme
VIAITADHGEEFLDHGGFEHGHSLHSELLHVPLLLQHASLAAARVADPVGHVDVLPTLCELAGWRAPDGLDGSSLVPSLHGARPPASPGLGYGNFWGPPLASLRASADKLIVYPQSSGRAPELFEWRGDPREQRDLAAARPDRSVEMQRRLQALLASLELKSNPARAADLDPALLRELERLGYSGGSDPANRRDR